MGIAEERISELIRKLPEEELPQGFSLALRERLEEEAEHEQNEQESRDPWSKWREVLVSAWRVPQYGLVALALLIAMIITPILWPRSGSVSVTLYSHAPRQVNVGEVALLRVEFRAAKDIDDVTFKVELPEGVMFVSAYEVISDSKALAFHGNLEKQKPIVIPVAVRITEEGNKTIRVKATELGEKSIVLKGRS